MQEYICTVKGFDGKTIKNYKLKAEDEGSLAAQIKANNLFLIGYKAAEEKKDILGGNAIRLSSRDLSLMCRQLSSMLAAGVTLVKSLDILYLQLEKKNIKEAVRRLYETVQKGDMLSESLRKQPGLYPELMISMVEAGEGSGKLDTVIERLATHFEKDVKMKNKVRTAMVYPIVLVCLCIAAVFFLVMKVLPTFVSMFQENNAVLPLPTRMVMAFSDFLTNYWLVGVGAVVLLTLGLRVYISSEAGKKHWHSFILQLPLLKVLTVKLAAARFTRSLSTLLSSGMNLIHALEISSRVVGNRVISAGLDLTREDIKRGMPMSTSLRKANILPPMVYSMIGIGEESGSIEHMLEKCADYYDDEVDNTITRMVSLLEPILIISMALIIGFIVVAMILPIWDLYGAMMQQ